MVELVVYSFVLALLALWIWPLLFNLSNLDYLLTNRDEAAPESVKFQRAKRAAANFQESYPVFLAISIIDIIQGVDVTSLATYWLVLRVLFMVTYTAGITYLRTLLWVGSLICLIMMAMALI